MRGANLSIASLPSALPALVALFLLLPLATAGLAMAVNTTPAGSPGTGKTGHSAKNLNSPFPPAKWFTENPVPAAEALFSLAVVDQKTVWAAGFNCAILKTKDGGLSWHKQAQARGNYLLPVSSVDAISNTRAWAVTSIPIAHQTPLLLLLRTVDGNSWENPAGSSGVPYDISACDESTLWIVGHGGLILKSTDGGESLHAQSSGTSITLYGVDAVSPQVSWAVGAGGTILKTIDGVTWGAQNSGVNVRLKGISAVNSQTAWAVGEDGMILKTTNGGASWTPQNSGVNSTLNGVFALSSSVAWAAGDNGVVLKTTNGGASWVAQNSGTNVHINSIAAADSTNAFCAGMAGTPDKYDLLKTTDGGASWHSVARTATRVNLYSVSAADAATAWAGGDGLIIGTSNGGITWNVQHKAGSQIVFSMSAVNSNTAWAALSSPFYTDPAGRVLKTNDGGATWTEKLTVFGSRFYGIAAVGENNAWVVGETGAGKSRIMKTVDGGNTWNDQSLDSVPGLRAVDAVSASCAWAVGSQGKILKTADGITWTEQTSGVSFELRSVSAASSQEAWVAGSGSESSPAQNGVLKTEDGGNTWVKTDFPGREYISSVAALGAGKAFVSSSFYRSYPALSAGSYVRKTANGGATWTLEETGSAFPLTSISMIDDDRGWGVGIFGEIVHKSLLGVTGIVPNYGVQGTVVEIIDISGSGFRMGANVRFEGQGTFVDAHNVSVISDSKLTCSLDLRGFPLGRCDVVVVNPGGNESRLLRGFRVTNICGGGASVLVLFGACTGFAAVLGASKSRRRKNGNPP